MCCRFVLEALLNVHRSALTARKLDVFSRVGSTGRARVVYRQLLRLKRRHAQFSRATIACPTWDATATHALFSNLPHSIMEERVAMRLYNTAPKSGMERRKRFIHAKAILPLPCRVSRQKGGEKALTTGFLETARAALKARACKKPPSSLT